MAASIPDGTTSFGTQSSIMSQAMPTSYESISFDGGKSYQVDSRFCKALVVASKRISYRHQPKAYVRICVRMAQAGEFEAVAALAYAILPRQEERMQVWTEMALMMIKNDTFTDVLPLAERIFDGSYDGNKKIMMIIQALVNKGLFDIAIAVTGVLCTSDKDEAWAQIASGFAEIGEHEKALEIAESIPASSPYRNTVFISITRELIRVGKLEIAYDVAMKVEDHFVKEELLQSVAESYAEAHQFEKALEIAEGMEKGVSCRARGFLRIAKEMAKIGLVLEAIYVAEIKMTGCESNISKYSVLKSIALELIPDHIAEALEILDTKIQNRSSFFSYRDEAFDAAAIKLIRTGFYGIAIDVAKQSKSETVWEQMAIEMIKAGQFSQVVEIAQKLDEKSKILIAEELKKAGHPDEARLVHDEISKETRTIAEELAKAGRFEEALSVMATMPSGYDMVDWERDFVCQCIVEEMAKSGLGGEAVGIAYKEISSPHLHRRNALMAIVNETVKTGHTPEEISAVEEAILANQTSGFGSLDGDMVMREIAAKKTEIEVLFKAITEAESKCGGASLDKHNALLAIAIRLFDAKRFDEEFSQFFEPRCALQKKTDVLMSIAAKLLLEYGYYKEAACVAEKILMNGSWEVGLYENIAAKMSDIRELEQLSNDATKIHDSEYRDRINLKIVDNLIGGVE